MSFLELRQQAAAALRNGDLSRAIDRFQEALRIRSDSTEVHHELAECHWAAYDFDKALQCYEDALASLPGSVETCTLAAKKLFGLARFRESGRWLTRAVCLAPRDANLLTMLGEVLERSNQLDDAERCAREALGLAPHHIRAVRLRAHLERRRGRLEHALEILKTQLTRFPGPEDWRLRYELAAVFDRLEEYDCAMRELLLAKEQLRPAAASLVTQASAVRRRQRDIAGLLARSDFEGWMQTAQASKPTVPIAFLCGHPRSGTTLLEQILAAHPEVVTTDETGVLVREFIDPIVWRSGSPEESVGELRGFDPGQIADGRSAYLRFTAAHLGEPVGTRLLIEKDPALTPDLPLPLRLFPEGRVIFPLRDPRDVCISYFFTLIPLAVSSAAALDLGSTVESCAHSLELWRHWKQTLPSPWLETRYESLVADPELETRRLLAFLNLPWNPGVLAFHKRSQTKGIRTPTYADAAQPVYQRAVGRWRNYEKHLTPHLDRLRPHLQASGYE